MVTSISSTRLVTTPAGAGAVLHCVVDSKDQRTRAAGGLQCDLMGMKMLAESVPGTLTAIPDDTESSGSGSGLGTIMGAVRLLTLLA